VAIPMTKAHGLICQVKCKHPVHARIPCVYGWLPRFQPGSHDAGLFLPRAIVCPAAGLRGQKYGITLPQSLNVTHLATGITLAGYIRSTADKACAQATSWTPKMYLEIYYHIQAPKAAILHQTIFSLVVHDAFLQRRSAHTPVAK
jgi:hypothetical protein